jgi:hypothetical protein
MSERQYGRAGRQSPLHTPPQEQEFRGVFRLLIFFPSCTVRLANQAVGSGVLGLESRLAGCMHAWEERLDAQHGVSWKFFSTFF